VTAEKVIAETALLLLACQKVAAGDPTLTSSLCKVAELLIPYARNEQTIINSCLHPGLTRDYAFAHICLSKLGFQDTTADQLFRLCLHAEVARGKERLPHRMLEQEWLKRVWDLSDTDSVDEFVVMRFSALGHSPDLFAATRDDIYALTHAVMYATDLGERTVRLPRPKYEILADAEVALAHCLDQQDYDLCGEILLAWPYLNAKWSASAAFAFQVLTVVEDAVGFLPAPLTRMSRYDALENEERSRYALATVYHTAYVMGLLCAAALGQGRTPPAAIPRTRRVGSAERILAMIEDQDQPPHWRNHLAQLDKQSQDALAPMLVTIALKRAVAGRDLAQVRKLLEYCVQNGIVNYPVVRQAAGLLRRFGELALHHSQIIPS
jgi:hypothetical protein